MKRTIRPGYYAGTRMAEYGTFGIQQDAYPLWGIWINDDQLKNITREWLQKETNERQHRPLEDRHIRSRTLLRLSMDNQEPRICDHR